MDWIFSLQHDVPQFLSALRGKKKGFVHYSQSGDYLSEQRHWGLGAASLYLKALYTLGLTETKREDVQDVVAYIKSFQRKDGYFVDRWVQWRSFPFRFYKAVRHGRLQELSFAETRRAETRQAMSALSLVGEHPEHPFVDVLSSPAAIDRFFSTLDWQTPWHAASHVSHQLFFLQHSDVQNKDELIDHIIQKFDALQQDDGAWYTGNPSLQQKINGAMKVITGLRAVDRVSFGHAKALIDLCLGAQHDTQACDNFNIVYVLTYADAQCNGSHRHDEIAAFMKDRVAIYKEYYYDDAHGFSFHKGRANKWYYGAPMSRGKKEPDIHGTVLFLWGLSLISRVLGAEEKIGLHEFIT